MERAGFWWRAIAFTVDTLLAQVALLLLVAALFAASGGRVVSTVSLYSACRPAAAPVGVSLPDGFAPAEGQLCTTGLFGATTRVLFVAHAGPLTSRRSFAVPVLADGSAAPRTFALDGLLYPILVLLRWATDRFAGGTPGRRVSRIAVADAGGTATGVGCRGPLARRYSRFAWPYLPGAVMLLAASAWEGAAGSPPPALAALLPVSTVVLFAVAQIAVAAGIVVRQDAYYDAAAGTAVLTRRELSRMWDMSPVRAVAAGLSVAEDLIAALASARRGVPWLSVALVGVMAAVFLGELALPWAPAGTHAVAPETLMAWGGVDRDLAISLFQPYRLLSSMFLHGNAAHLAVNSIMLLIVGWLLERRLGPTLYGALFILCGVAGAAVSIAFNPPLLVTVGASGAVLGLFAVAFPVSFATTSGEARRWLRTWPVVVCPLALLPVAALPGALVVDRFDHAGGELAGLLLGTLVAASGLGRGARRLPGRAGAVAALAAAAAVGATMLVSGWRAPIQSARLVPPGALPPGDKLDLPRIASLAERYPDDPRVLSALAQAEVVASRPDAALRDADRALEAARRLSPSAARGYAYALRIDMGSRFAEGGDLRAAIAQYTSALDAQADGLVALRQRGIAEYYAGEPGPALKDLDAAVQAGPADAYAALWDDIVAVRAGEPDRRGALGHALKGQAWPAPVLRFYQGEISADALETAVSDPGPISQADRQCEADFYRGERLIMRSWAAEARSAIEAAAAECPTNFIEREAAREELAGHGGLPGR